MKTPGQELYEIYSVSNASFTVLPMWGGLSALDHRIWEDFATRVQPPNPWVCSAERLPGGDEKVEVYYPKSGHLELMEIDEVANRSDLYWRRFTPPAPKDPFEEWWAAKSDPAPTTKELALSAWNAAMAHLGKTAP